MNIRSKLVAFVLLLGLIASPAVAMSQCWRNGLNGSGQPCEPHCPKMAMTMNGMPQTALVNSRALPPISTCCRVSPSRPEPASQVVASNNASAGIASSVRFPLIPVVRPEPARSDAAPPPPVTLSQAVLCTFLI